MSFRFKAKENLQHCGDVFFDILITSKDDSSLGIDPMHKWLPIKNSFVCI